MITVKNLKLEPVGILNNAYDINYTKEDNQIWLSSFNLPLNDPKKKLLKHLHYVEIYDELAEEPIGLFRIMDIDEHKSIDSQRVTVSCLHVLHTLSDSVINNYYQKDNLTTRQNIEELLKLQNSKDWVLGKCDFTRYYSYSWENENGLLDALFSIPKSFNEAYTFTWDTTSYPWTINLIKPDTKPTCRIMEGHNLKGLDIQANPLQMVNRIHAKGIGEGVNSLTFKTINGGKDYVQDNTAIAENGGRIISYVWVDRRFTDKEHLLSSAKGLLDKWSKPVILWKISAIDLNSIHVRQTGNKLDLDDLKQGKVVRLVTNDYGVQDLRIMKATKNDITGSPWDIVLEIGNVGQTLAGTLADSERQNEINTNYANGATNLFLVRGEENADSSHPIKIWFNLDEDVFNINQVRLDVEVSSFRAYSKAIKGGGAMVGTTSSGGYTASSTSSGGGSVQGGTSQAGGATQVGTTSSAGGSHSHKMFMFRGKTSGIDEYVRCNYQATGNSTWVVMETLYDGDLWTDTSSGNHNHSVSMNLPAHSHNFNVNIPSHTHNFTVPAHTHNLTLPDHSHEIEFGIFEHSDRASKLKIAVDGSATPLIDTNINFKDIIPYLKKDSSGLISKGKHSIEITPDKLAHISAQVTCRVFIRSQVGGEF